MQRFVLSVCIVIAAIACPTGARAAPGKAKVDTKAEAREHYRRGMGLFDVGRYVEAAKEFELAFEKSDQAALLFNMGQAYRLAGDAEHAIAAYRGFLRRVPDAPQRAEVETNLKGLLEKRQREEAEKQRARAEESPKEKPARPAEEVQSAPAPTVTVAPAPPAPVRARRRWWPWVVGAGVGLVVVGVGVGLGVALTRSSSYPAAEASDGRFRF